MANIKIVRLLSGEEILGDIELENEYVIVKNPTRIVVVPGKDPNNPQIGLMPFCQWAVDKEVSVNISMVVCILTPIADFVNQYNKTFSSILVPDTGLVLPT